MGSVLFILWLLVGLYLLYRVARQLCIGLLIAALDLILLALKALGAVLGLRAPSSRTTA